MTQQVKRAFKFRFHPTDAQVAELVRTFGCVRRRLTPAKMEAPLAIVWSRPLPEGVEPTAVSVAGSAAMVSSHSRDTNQRPAPSRETVTVVCSACGALQQKLPLNVREWVCACGAHHDRDVNAARNILAAGRAVIACGDGVRPQRDSSRTGRSSAKRETRRATAGTPAR